MLKVIQWSGKQRSNKTCGLPWTLRTGNSLNLASPYVPIPQELKDPAELSGARLPLSTVSFSRAFLTVSNTARIA